LYGIISAVAVHAFVDESQPSSHLTWEHCDSSADLLLSLPDVAGWCYGAGGEWRKRIERILSDVVNLALQ
jgi:hypothetical protein